MFIHTNIHRYIHTHTYKYRVEDEDEDEDEDESEDGIILMMIITYLFLRCLYDWCILCKLLACFQYLITSMHICLLYDRWKR